MDDTPGAPPGPQDNGALLLEVVKAFEVCSDASTRAGVKPAERIERITRALSTLMAAFGPGHRVTLDDLLERLSGDQAGQLEGLIPPWLDAADLCGVRLLDFDSVPTAGGFDFRQEAELVRRNAKRLGKQARGVTAHDLDAEYSQESVFRSIKGEFYQRHRTTLITRPVVPAGELAELLLPLQTNRFYRPVEQYAQHCGWFFPCTACQWPMRITITGSGKRASGTAQCLYPWHTDTGSMYVFTPTGSGEPPTLHPAFECRQPSARHARLWTGTLPHVPQPMRAADHLALHRAVWRYTTVSGLPELRIHRALEEELVQTGYTPVLWPFGDTFDHAVMDHDHQILFSADFKDYTWTNHLIAKIHRDAGDSGGAKWLIVPDHRDEQVDHLNAVGRSYGLQAITATNYLETVVQTLKKGGRDGR
ncbi:hypothetical protein OG689_41315 [Kitasatospora sp. NBC_00240]|uniref:restriction endonuclease-related protein n=1 Tax=Kitasatospora sp. NBC_00240 TaxID=2903567 RepID=UPI0022539CF4|nr:hypothetical protein [Kitasatospora sp. NBC_00240]MCX5215596.1 hypothetical protein [Kitasatospora sp. NBC_00240]